MNSDYIDYNENIENIIINRKQFVGIGVGLYTSMCIKLLVVVVVVVVVVVMVVVVVVVVEGEEEGFYVC